MLFYTMNTVAYSLPRMYDIGVHEFQEISPCFDDNVHDKKPYKRKKVILYLII